MPSVLADFLELYLTPNENHAPFQEPPSPTDEPNSTPNSTTIVPSSVSSSETDERVDQDLIITLIREVREANRLSHELREATIFVLDGIVRLIDTVIQRIESLQ
jgi:hypothetical protein